MQKTNLLVLVAGLFLTCCATAKFRSCIEDADQSKAEARIERIDPAKDTFYEYIFTSDSSRQFFSKILPEVWEEKLKGRSNIIIKGKYSIEKISPEHFNYILSSTNDSIPSNMLVMGILLKNENTTLVHLSYYKCKHFCKSLVKTKFFEERKRVRPKRMHEKIKVKNTNKFRAKKEVLLIIQDGKVERVELKK